VGACTVGYNCLTGKLFAPERPNPLPPPPAPRPLLLKPASQQQQSQQAMPTSTALLEKEAQAGENMAAHSKEGKDETCWAACAA